MKNTDPISKIKHRRELLKGLIAGSAIVTGSKALPNTWTKPLTNSVILPGHAITTGDFARGDYGDYTSITGDEDQARSSPDGVRSGTRNQDTTDTGDYTGTAYPGDHEYDSTDTTDSPDLTNDSQTIGDFTTGDGENYDGNPAYFDQADGNDYENDGNPAIYDQADGDDFQHDGNPAFYDQADGADYF